MVTVLENDNAPSTYSYQFDSDELGSFEHGEDGEIAVLSKSGDPLAFVAPAWAKDANGTPVQTHYELDGSTLKQVVETDTDTSFPVVADPYLGVKMVKKVKWTKRAGGKTLVVTPTAGSRALGGGYLPGKYGWKEVSKLGKTKSTQLKWQYICHHQFAFTKKTYNLDTWKKRKSYADSVKHLCN